MTVFRRGRDMRLEAFYELGHIRWINQPVGSRRRAPVMAGRPGFVYMSEMVPVDPATSC